MSEKLRRKIEKKLATLQGPEWDSEDEEEEEEGGKPATNSRKRTGNQANGGTGRKAEPGSSVRKKRCLVIAAVYCVSICRVSSKPVVVLMHCGLYGCVYVYPSLCQGFKWSTCWARSGW